MPNAPAVKLSDEQIAGYAKGAGFSGNALVTVVAIALAESSGGRIHLMGISTRNSVDEVRQAHAFRPFGQCAGAGNRREPKRE